MKIAMDSFEKLFSQLFTSLESKNEVEMISCSFDSLCLDKKVAFVYNLYFKENLLPGYTKRKHGKSAEKAEEKRNEGNKMFLSKKDEHALKQYNKCISYAPVDSQELCLGYANRSAVLYSLGKYRLCLKDIDRAFINYPSPLKYKLLERKAKCLYHLGDKESAKIYFEEALMALPKTNTSDSSYRRIESSLKNITLADNEINGNSEKETKVNAFLPQLTDANEYIPNASKSVSVKYCEEMGRYVVANCDIKPGEIIVVEDPYASVLLPEYYFTHCYHCFSRCLTLIPCKNCALVMFCGEDCYSKSWHRNHRIECQLLQYVLNLKLGKMEILALRILLIATKSGDFLEGLRKSVSQYSFGENHFKGFDENGYYISSEYCSVHHLEGNIEKRSVADLFKRCALAAFLLHCLRNTDYFDAAQKNYASEKNNKLTEPEMFAGTLLLRYLCIIPCNAHEVTEIIGKSAGDGSISYSTLEIGACLYPMLSLVNHSCNPNVVRHSYNDTVVLHCIEPIKAGEQVYDNYGYHYAVHPLKDRQIHLCLQYHFKCECEACRFHWPLYENIPFTVPAILTDDETAKKKLLKSSETFKESLLKVIDSDIEGQLEILYDHLVLLYETVKRPWREYNDCQEAIKQCLALKANHYSDKHYILL